MLSVKISVHRAEDDGSKACPVGALRRVGSGNLLPGAVALALVAVAVTIPTSSQAQCSGSVSWTNAGDGPAEQPTCSTGAICSAPVTNGPSVSLSDPGCDPVGGSCGFGAAAFIVFPGNHDNTLFPGYSYATVKLLDANGSFVGECGAPTAPISQDMGVFSWGFNGSCSEPGAVFEVVARSCPCFGTCPHCEETQSVTVGLGPAGTTYCGARPPAPPCEGNCLGCIAGEMPPSTGSDMPGKGGASGCGTSVGGGGPTVCPTSGPGAILRYLARGVGHPTFPGSGEWTTSTGLGRYWSHEWAELIVRDPDDDHVWLLTREGGFKEFTNTEPDPDGLYEEAAPSDEYRKLFRTAQGWELRDLGGGIQFFDDGGRWTLTRDRNGNETEAIYDSVAPDRLAEVRFPDERKEQFIYGFNGASCGPEGCESHTGMLFKIREIGIDDSLKAEWIYTWSGSDLQRVDRPDGTALEFFYNETKFPGYLTRMELVGTEGDRRVIGGWAYDEFGNVTGTWKGDTIVGLSGEDLPGPGAVDRYSLAFPADASQGFLGDVAVTGPLGNLTTYSVDRDPSSNKPRVAMVDGDCPVCGTAPYVAFDYADETGHPLRIESQMDGEGSATAFTYNSRGQMLSKTEAVATSFERTTTWEYEDPDFDYLPSAVIVESVDGLPSERRITMDYSGEGDIEHRTISGAENGSAFSLTTDATYNSEGRPLTIDPPGFDPPPAGFDDDVTVYTYYGNRGLLIPETRDDPEAGFTSFVYDSFNRRSEVTDPNGVASKTEYDALDRVTKVTEAFGSGADRITEYQYNELGDLEYVIQPALNRVRYGYDAAGRLEWIERRDADNVALERTFYTLDAASNRVLEELQSWDGQDWVTESTTGFDYSTPCRLDQVVHGDGSVTEYEYDCNGNLEKVWDANHPKVTHPTPTTQYNYDALNRLEQITQPLEEGGTAVTAYGYDHQDHLTSVTDANGNVTSYTYSDRDLLTRQISSALEEDTCSDPQTCAPGCGCTQYTYNDHGELEGETEPRGIQVISQADALDRIRTVTYPTDVHLNTTFTYDNDLGDPNNYAIGRLVTIARGTQPPVIYRWDRFGRMTQDGMLGYAYDANGNRDTINYPGGATATYGYDFADRQASLEVSGVEPDPIVVIPAGTTAYKPFGPLAALELESGLTETRTFDARYFPDRIKVTSTTDTLLDWDYFADAVGNITEIEDDLTPVRNRVFRYKDYQYFLKCAIGPWNQDPSDCDAVPPTGDPLEWTYDAIGNRLAHSTTEPDRRTDIYTYRMDGSARTPVLETVDLGAPIMGTHTYIIDQAGNLELFDTGSTTVTLQIDEAGRIESLVHGPDNARVSLDYDGRSFLRGLTEVPLLASLRVAMPETLIFQDGFESGDFSAWSSCVGGPGCGPPPPRVLEPLYDSAGLFHGLNSDELGRLYVFYFAGRPVAQVEEGDPEPSWKYLTTDHLGSPIYASDQNGQELWQGGFTPFGGDYSDAHGAGIVLRLPGQWDDPIWESATSGIPLYYNVHRWYEYGTGRYTRVDPIGPVDGGPQVYAYAFNRPLIWVDPLGLEVLVCSRPCCGGLGNHAYLWDTRPGLPQEDRYCGGFSDAQEQGPGGPGVVCRPVPGSPGREDEAMQCCRFFKKHEPPQIPGVTYIPPLIDCQSQLARALDCAGLENPRVPGGRLGCRDCEPVEAPPEPLIPDFIP